MDPFDALDSDDLKVMVDAIKAGFDINSERDGFTLLHAAIDSEADVHIQSGEPLHVDATALLLALGADPKRRPSGGRGISAEHMAFQIGHWMALELFRGKE